MEKIRWGVLSTAKIGLTQLIPAIGRAGNAEFLAIASRGVKVHAIAEELHIPKAYESYEELLDDPEIDAVYIPLPNHLHKEWTMKAADKGKHVLCEKPAALTAEEAEEMMAYCQARNVKFMEAFMYQLHPQHAEVKKIVDSGEIGELKLIKSSHSFFMTDRDENIRMVKNMGGGSLYDVGSYCIQAIRHISGSEPVEVQAFAEIDQSSGVDITTWGWIQLENGVKGIFDCSFDMAPRNEYEVVGTKGSIHVPFAFRPDIAGGQVPVIVKSPKGIREEKYYGDIYKLEVENFSQAILSDGEPWITNESTMRNMQVVDACYNSMATGKSVKVKSK